MPASVPTRSLNQTKPGDLNWSPRVPPHWIRRLYESDALGLLDEELLDEAGWGLYARCRDLIEVAEAQRGRVKCRNCGQIIQRRQGQVIEPVGHGPLRVGGLHEVLACSRCSWSVTWGDYRRSLRGKNMDASGVQPLLEAFVEQWPTARSPQARLLLIDRLIHAFHVSEDGVGSSVGARVIQATGPQVILLLSTLACGPGSTAGLPEARELWASHLMARESRHSAAELRAIAGALGVKGASRLRKAELIEAIERLDPGRLG